MIIGRYDVHGEIAAGGMASVHFGTLRGDQGFRRVVAIKRMHPKLASDPRFMAMFRDEARLASRVRHPNVVPTLDVVEGGGDVAIVMEYVRGLPLSTLLARASEAKEEVPVPIAVAILGGVLAGLHAAHEARGADGAPLDLVHRDVSPQNVLVDVDGVARVMDFGIAKASTQLHVTLEGEIKGKIAFMAPEQIKSRTVDRRVDVFAAAVVFYSMLQGGPLFMRGEVDEVMDRVLHMPIPPLFDRRPEVGQALSDVIARALERDPDARHPTARDFAVAVEAAFDRPASARQLGAWVERLGHAALAARDRDLARIERDANEPDVPSEGPLEITATDAPTLELSDDAHPRRPPVLRRPFAPPSVLHLGCALTSAACGSQARPRHRVAPGAREGIRPRHPSTMGSHQATRRTRVQAKHGTLRPRAAGVAPCSSPSARRSSSPSSSSPSSSPTTKIRTPIRRGRPRPISPARLQRAQRAKPRLGENVGAIAPTRGGSRPRPRSRA